MRVSVLLVCLLSLAGADLADQTPFKPLTYGLNFKAYFRVQAFANQEPIYSGNIYESYHSQLGACLIKQTSRDVKTGRSTSKRFLYDSRASRLVEFTDRVHVSQLYSESDATEPFIDNDFHLYENGGSNTYRPDRLLREFREGSVRLVPDGANIDGLLLMGHDQEDLTLLDLDLDQFMTPACLEVLRRARLNYVSGLTRLLHLIECRRDEFKQVQQTSLQQVELTRGQTRRVYRARKLEATHGGLTDSKAIGSLDLLVTVHNATSSTGDTLEPGAMPLSIVLTCEPAFSILINLYQFESLGPDDHLSESANGHSTYLMPLAQPNLSHLLTTIQSTHEEKETNEASRQARSFSFEAVLTGSHLSQFYPDPIELVVSYDAQLGALATWLIFTDRTQSDGLTGWVRPTVRQLRDSSSGLKFHLMDSNFGYVSHGGEDNDEEMDSGQPKWRTCATDKLTAAEITELQEGSDGRLFDLAGATYMGEALVRGIRCQVYERRLFELPELLGVSENDYVHLGAHLAQSKIYLNLYAYGGDDLASPRFARLDVRIVSHLDEAQQRSLTLEISAFDWSSSGVQSRDLFTGEHLLARLSQECLLMVPGARHLDMELWFGLANGVANKSDQQSFRANEMLLARLAGDREARDHSVREMLATGALGMSAVQQVDLVTETHLHDNHDHDRQVARINFDQDQVLYVKFSLYELWSDFVQEDFIGYAKSLTLDPMRFRVGSLVAGARSYSYAECKWRAVHSLLPDRKRSEYNRRDDDDKGTDLRLFMFCPVRSVCLLGDTAWTPMRRQKPLKLDHLLEYPYVAPTPDDDKPSEQMGDDPTKCVVASVLIKQQAADRERRPLELATTTPARPQLYWWLINGAPGLGRAGDSQALKRVRELRLELKVKGSFAPASATSTLGVQVNKLKLSNRVFINPSDGDKNTNSSLLIKPLAGLAYLPDTRPAPGAAIISTQPLVVASLAECSRACLHSHECRSFSACHEQQHSVSCVLSRLGWSSEPDFHKLVRLADSNSPDKGALMLEVSGDDDKDGSEQIYLRRSRMCSVRARAQMDLYRLARLDLDNVPSPKYLIPSRSLEHCARLCQERARLMRELSEAKNGATNRTHVTGLGGSFRSASCNEFRFAREFSYCELLPMQNHWAVLGLEHLLEPEKSAPAPPDWLVAAHEKRAALPTLNRWLRSFTGSGQLAEWLAQLRVRSITEADHYELDFEQIFLAQRNRRLVLTTEVPQQEDEFTGSQPQVRLTQFSLFACAKRCLQLTGCRSFDVELPAAAESQRVSASNRAHLALGGGQQRANVCQLNVLSAADLAANPSAWPSFELRHQGCDSPTEWWHYEPSELALFMISDPSEPGLINAP